MSRHSSVLHTAKVIEVDHNLSKYFMLPGCLSRSLDTDSEGVIEEFKPGPLVTTSVYRCLSAAGSETFQKRALSMRTHLKDSTGAIFAGLAKLLSCDGMCADA